MKVAVLSLTVITDRDQCWAAGTVEAGAGAGEGVKRKRSDNMAALEADLAPEPQAG